MRIIQAPSLRHQVQELAGIGSMLWLSENALSLGSGFKASWEPVLVYLRCQCTIRNVNPPTEPWAMDSQGQKPKHPEGHWDSNKEGSGRGKFLTFPTFSHSQLAKVEWKSHYWMFSLCHSEEHPWLSHRPSLSTEKQRVCFICLLRCPKAQQYIKLNRKGAGRLQHTELLTVLISE